MLERLDGRWRSPNGEWAATSQVVATALHSGPPRTLRDGTVQASGDVGYGARLKIAKEGGLPWYGDLSYEGASRHLDFNDLGYMPRQNIHVIGGGVEYRTLAPMFGTLETYTRADIRTETNINGIIVGHGYQVSSTWKLSNFWVLYVSTDFSGRRFDDREVGDGTALERRESFGGVALVRSDPRRVVYVDLSVEGKRILPGSNIEGYGTVTFRVLPQLDIAVEPRLAHTGGERRFAAHEGDALLFGALSATELSATIRSTYTFTPRLSLQVYTQGFLAAGHYSNFGAVPAATAGRGAIVHLADLRPAASPQSNPDFTEAALNANVVFRWEYSLGSTIFLVYTRSQIPHVELLPGQRGSIDTSGLARAPATDTLLVKLSHFF